MRVTCSRVGSSTYSEFPHFIPVAATTRKEEILRFSKATSTAEFTKMMKLRTLGPEHLETQTKLRKQMRVGHFTCFLSHSAQLAHQNIRDRVEKLEAHLQSSKKTLSRQKSGKVAFKYVAPHFSWSLALTYDQSAVTGHHQSHLSEH